MGRGRQKAKQTKVARELKYHSSSIDVHALQRELGNGTYYEPAPPTIADPVEDDEDPYASYAGPDLSEDDEGEPADGYASHARQG